MNPVPRRLLLAAGAFVLAACVDGSVSSSSDTAALVPTTMAVAIDQPFPDERCVANREAGDLVIAVETGSLGASGTVDVLVAADRGYYRDLCLDVTVVGVDDPIGALGDGSAHFAVAPSFASLVDRSTHDDLDLLALTVDGRTSLDTLIVAPPTATEPLDPSGWTVASHGGLPGPVAELVERLGVDRESLDVIERGGHRIVDLLGPSGGADAVVGAKSTDVVALERDGVGVEQIDPREYGVAGSFGVLATSAALLDEQPIAVVDVVRSTLRGLDDAVAAPETVIESLTAGRALDVGDDPELGALRWIVEAELIETGTPEGVGLGAPVSDPLQAELDDATSPGEPASNADDHLAEGVAASVYDSDAVLIWPA